MSCTAAIRKIHNVAVVDLGGRFTIGDAQGVIRGAVIGLLDEGERNVLLNLAHVTYLDSAAGIGELVSSYTSATRLGGDLKLTGVPKSVRWVLQITALDTVFEIFDDEEAALRAFEKSRPAPAGSCSTPE